MFEGEDIHVSRHIPLPSLGGQSCWSCPALWRLTCCSSRIPTFISLTSPPTYTVGLHSEARMNNADFKTALLQRMLSSHTVNTNKPPKGLKSRTPSTLPCPLPVHSEACRVHIPPRDGTKAGFVLCGPGQPHTWCLLPALAGEAAGQGQPQPLPDHLQAKLRYGKTSEQDKHSEEWSKSNKVTLLHWQPLPNLQAIWKLFIYKIIKISCPILPHYLASTGLLMPCTPCSGETAELWWRWLWGATSPWHSMAHTVTLSPVPSLATTWRSYNKEHNEHRGTCKVSQAQRQLTLIIGASWWSSESIRITLWVEMSCMPRAATCLLLTSNTPGNIMVPHSNNPSCTPCWTPWNSFTPCSTGLTTRGSSST